MHDLRTYDAAVIAGGLAGLTATTLLARAGKSEAVEMKSAWWRQC